MPSERTCSLSERAIARPAGNRRVQPGYGTKATKVDAIKIDASNAAAAKKAATKAAEEAATRGVQEEEEGDVQEK